MPTSIITTDTIAEADAVILSAPYEHTASSRKGTKAGPRAIIDCLRTKLEFYDRDLGCEPNQYIHIIAPAGSDMDSLTPEEALADVTARCEDVLSQSKFPLLLGGEHSVTLGLFQALAKKYDPSDITIVQIDAHCDLRDTDGDYSDEPSRLAHSCVMRRGHELGFHLVQVGIRTYSTAEHAYFADPKNDIAVFEWGRETVPTIENVLASINTKYVHLSIDVDGFDPSSMPGTGTPVQGGLEWWYGVDLIKQLIKNHTLVGADIVEVSPMADSVVTEYGAAQLCYSIISHVFRHKLPSME